MFVTTTTTAYPVPYFDFNSPRYRCCCCHVTTAAYVIGILELIGVVITLIISGLSFGDADDRSAGLTAVFVVQLIIAILILVAVCMLFYAVNTQKYKFVIPHLAVQGLYVVLSFCWLIVYIVAVSGNESLQRSLYGDEYYCKHNGIEKNDDGVKVALIFAIISAIVGIAIQCWWFYAIYACYIFLKEKTAFDRQHPGGQYGGSNVVAYEGPHPQYIPPPAYVNTTQQYGQPVVYPPQPYVPAESKPAAY